MILQIETWRMVAGYDKYEASNLGRVRSLQSGIPRLLIPNLKKNGYLRIQLCRSGHRRTIGVHRAVLMAFKGDSLLHCNHKNGVKNDNRLVNLEYCTHQENMIHRGNVLNVGIGENCHKSKLNNAKVRRIRAMLNKRVPICQIARSMEVGWTAIYNVSKGITWSHVDRQKVEVKV